MVLSFFEATQEVSTYGHGVKADVRDLTAHRAAFRLRRLVL